MKRLSWFLMAALKAMLGFRLAVPLRVQVGYVGDGRLSIWASIRCCEHDDRTGDSSVLDGANGRAIGFRSAVVSLT